MAGTSPGDPDGLTRVRISRLEVGLGLGSFLAWCVLFDLGNSVGALPFFQTLNSQDVDVGSRLLSFIMIALTYTPLNIFVLSCLAGYAGCFYSRIEQAPPAEAERPRLIWKRYILAVFGSFMIYLIVLSGTLAIAGFPFQLPEIENKAGVEDAQSRYRVTASFCSFFCMVEGARPFVIKAVAGRIQAILLPSPSRGDRGTSQSNDKSITTS